MSKAKIPETQPAITLIRLANGWHVIPAFPNDTRVSRYVGEQECFVAETPETLLGLVRSWATGQQNAVQK